MRFGEKMQLVWANGPLDQLNDVIAICNKSNGKVHPARATEHMNATGFIVPNEQSPWGALVEKIEDIAHGHTLPIVNPAMEDGKHEGNQIFLQALQEEMDKERKDEALLQEQLTLCLEGTQAYSHFLELDVPVDETKQRDYIKIRFGHMPRRGYALLQREYADDPYVLFVPCGEDSDNIWGIYFAPKEMATRVDGVFSEAYFERLQLPGAAGTPSEIVRHLNENITLLHQEIAKSKEKQKAIWNREKWRLAGLYASVCQLARQFELRKCAAVRGDWFCFCAWMEESYLPTFQEKCALVGGLSVAPDLRISQREWKHLQ